MAENLRHSLFVEFLGGDHADFVFAGEIEIVFAVDLAAQTDLQNATVLQQAFFEGAAEWRAVRILAAEIFVPEIVVGVELDEGHRAAVFFRDSAKNRQADGVVAAYAGGAGSGGQDRSDALLDAAEGVFNRERIYGEVAEVGDAIFFEGIQFEDRIPGTDDRGLDSDVARAEARAGSIGCAAVEGHANDGNVEFFGLRDVRETHEGGDTREARVFQGVDGLRMREAVGTSGLLFWHEPGMLGAECGEVNARRRRRGVHAAFTWE